MLVADLAARHPLGGLKCSLGDLKCCEAGLRALRAGSPGSQRFSAESPGKGRHTIPEELLRGAGAEVDGGGVRGAFSAEEIKTVGTLGCALVQYYRLDVEDEARSLDEAEHDYFPEADLGAEVGGKLSGLLTLKACTAGITAEIEEHSGKFGNLPAKEAPHAKLAPRALGKEARDTELTAKIEEHSGKLRGLIAL